MAMSSPMRIINASAPTRICDNGGWTDTWFAGHGHIFNIAVAPRVEVQLLVFPRATRAERVVIHAANFGDHYAWQGYDSCVFERHPLLEATIAHVGLPADVAIQLYIQSAAPHGAAMGTSAAVCVAVAAALDALTPDRRGPHQLAYLAHAVETERLGQQSGIQDQLAAAYGGINEIEMIAYPETKVRQLDLPDETILELERRLTVIYLGQPHNSSAIHESVIKRLEKAGSRGQEIAALRATAGPSRQALLMADFPALGAAMKQNTVAQQALHPELVSPAAAQIIALAREHGALGWKVNGAGGDGGSVTLLSGPERQGQMEMVGAILHVNRAWREIPIRLSPAGVQVWS